MNTVKQRFYFQLSKVEKLVNNSFHHENPALWLFLNDLRTPMFMLEGLCKMYEDIQHDKMFDSLFDRFKSIEDALGAVDHYIAMYKMASSNNKIDIEFGQYFYEKAQEKIYILDHLLEDEGWFSGKRLKKIVTKLKNIDDLSLEKENEAIVKKYDDDIAEIVAFYKAQKGAFSDMESGVHEFRRKIRWLSIYPHALNGVMQLSSSKPVSQGLKKYLTPEVMASAYNILPDNKDKLTTINIDKNCFYALSWLIAHIGTIKDQGLTIHALVEAHHEIYFDKTDVALQKSYKLLGSKHPRINDLLQESSTITTQFMEENILNKLIIR